METTPLEQHQSLPQDQFQGLMASSNLHYRIPKQPASDVRRTVSVSHIRTVLDQLRREWVTTSVFIEIGAGKDPSQFLGLKRSVSIMMKVMILTSGEARLLKMDLGFSETQIMT